MIKLTTLVDTPRNASTPRLGVFCLDAGTLYFGNGTAWTSLGGGGGGITSVNGQSGPTVTLTAANVGAVPATQVPTSSVRGGVLQNAAIANLTAAPTQADFNGLLAALRTAGVISAT